MTALVCPSPSFNAQTLVGVVGWGSRYSEPWEAAQGAGVIWGQGAIRVTPFMTQVSFPFGQSF